VGYTDRTARERIEEQLHTSKEQYEIVLVESAMSNDGSCFTDKDVHRVLESKGYQRLNPGDKTDEWFRCTATDVTAAIMSLRTGSANVENRTHNFEMRPEQYRAVEQTMHYFAQAVKDDAEHTPKFLWNAKMRFGKTFASYQLAKKMGLKRVLVLTFKPAVESAWREDLVTHMDFEGWQYISNKDARNNNLNIDQEFEISGLDDINIEIGGLGLKPVFEVNISHPLTIEAMLSGTITPYQGGVAVEQNALMFSDIALAAARYENGSITPSDIRLIIADKSLREKYASQECTFVECDVEKLLQGSLPDGFKINLTLGIDPTEVKTLYIADNFDITYDYSVDIPITLDNSLNISYADEIYELNSTFSALADYDIKVEDVTLIAVVANSTPLELAAEVTLKDVNGNDTEAQVRIDEGAKILGSTNGEVVESRLRLGIDLGDSASIAKLAEVDGIAFALNATSAAVDDSVALNLDQTIGVKLQLEVAGGVTIDLEDLEM
jgi:hypothetical protein